MWRQALIIVVLLSGCAATKQARNVETSAFLADVSHKLVEGKEGQALLVYRNPKIDTRKRGSYDKIQLDPVMIWRGAESRARGGSREELQKVADDFYRLIYRELAKDWGMVDKPGPKTLRIQVALTKLRESYVALDVVSTVVPQVRGLSTLKDLATGKPLFVGEASVETKVTDGQTGELLWAAVDRRVGRKTLSASSFDSWGDVYDTLEYWARQARFRLCQGRGGEDCLSSGRMIAAA